MTGRWTDNAERAIEMMAREGGEAGLRALAIVAAQMRARNPDSRQYEVRTAAAQDWIPESDWRWIAGLSIRHLKQDGPQPLSPPASVIGAYWAAYDEMRDMMRRELRPVALSASRRLELMERRRGPLPTREGR